MEYNTTLRINDRLYYDIDDYCYKNGIDMREYLVELIEAQHMINKYGDLNEILPKAIEESKVEVKKRGRPKKKVEEEKKVVVYEPVEGVNGLVEELKENSEEKEIPHTKSLEEYVNEVNNEKVEVEKTKVLEEQKKKPTAKRKRTLKTL